MWPFRKGKKVDEAERAIGRFIHFRDVGETFNYRGIEMIVEGHVILDSFGCTHPCLCAAYKNAKGELCRTSFYPGDLPALKAENRGSHSERR
jgi:hypothetical protein